MRNFPKRIATAADIRNCKALVDSGVFEASELLKAIENLENMNYLHCPVLAVGDDRKTVTVKYCAEAQAGTKAIIGGKTVTISTVTHEEGETDENGETQLETTVLTVSAMVSTDSEVAEIKAPYTIYDSIGITATELEKIKEELTNE